MIFNKLHYLTYFRSITVILRNYNKRNFRPFIMPKDNKLYLNQLQKQRKRIKAQATKYTPSQICIQVIGPGTRGGCRSVLLITDHTNYLFNCGEGTQRLATEYHARLTKIEHIFVTKPTWENMGGIPGVALTVQDTGVPTLYLHGPDGSTDIIEATQNFMTLDELSLLPADTTKEYSDQTMTVTYIPIVNPKAAGDGDSVNSNLSFDNINYYNYEVNSNDKRSLFSQSSKKKTLKMQSSVTVTQIDSMMVFVCKVHRKEGALDFEKCVAAGVTPGPSLKKLKSGEDITLEDGRIVKSEDVVKPSQPGPLFIVLECPSEDWIDVIVDNPAFQKYQLETATDKDQVARYVIHFSPENVLQNSKYKEWIRKFGLKTQHLVVNEHNNGYTSEALHKMQHQLHLLHPNIFPFFGGQQNFLEESNNEENSSNKMKVEEIEEEILEKRCENSGLTAKLEVAKKENEVKTSTSVNNNEPIIHQCQTLNTFHLRPDRGFDIEKKVQIHPKEYVQEVFEIDGFLDALTDLQTELNAKTKSLGDIEEYPKLLMLGTGSSVPNKVRNTSGMLLQLDEDRSIVLDCGEGTMGQLLTFFGKSKIDRVLKSIKAVYVSHLHADHHLGFIGIIKQREKITDEPLFLLAPQNIFSYLQFYNNRFESITKQFRLVSNRDLLMNQCILSPSVAKDMYDLLGIDKICTSFVTHCPFAYGIAITLKDGRKICYSGDTVPCESMVKLASDSFLLIHEATMEDGLENEAIIKKHSTISQAINIGVKANAQYTLLTHFSQRYSKIPLLPSAEQNGVDFNRVGIAYDFMSVSLSQLPLLSCFYPCLALMFHEFRALLDERAYKREQKKEQLVKSAER